MAMAIGRGSPVMSPWVNKSPAASGLRGRQGFYSAPWKRTNIKRQACRFVPRRRNHGRPSRVFAGASHRFSLRTLRLPILRKRRLFRESEKVTLSAIELVGPTLGR